MDEDQLFRDIQTMDALLMLLTQMEAEGKRILHASFDRNLFASQRAYIEAQRAEAKERFRGIVSMTYDQYWLLHAPF